MASHVSILPDDGTVHFSPDFVAHLAIYQNAIRGHRVAGWARDRGLLDDLVQLALIDLARVESRFDPERATTHHHYRMAVLGSRVYDCFDLLKRMHGDVMCFDNDREQLDPTDCGSHGDRGNFDEVGHDAVFAEACCAQLVRALIPIVEALPPVQRKVIELALADHSEREIADALGVSIQAVNVARRKGLAKIEAALTEGRYLN